MFYDFDRTAMDRINRIYRIKANILAALSFFLNLVNPVYNPIFVPLR